MVSSPSKVGYPVPWRWRPAARTLSPSPRGFSRRNAVHISDMNWMQVEEYLTKDDRAVVPLGSTEQHGYLSLMVDALIP